MTHPSIVDQDTNITLTSCHILDCIEITLIKWILSHIDADNSGIDVGILLFDFRLEFFEFRLRTGDEDEIESVFGEGKGKGLSNAGGWSCYDCVGWTITFAELFDLRLVMSRGDIR